MPTYTKETALYDTGAIKNGIDGAAETASKYITTVGNTGIKVHPYNESSGQADPYNYTKVDANGMEVFKQNAATNPTGSNSVASFGDTARVGMNADGHSRTEISASGVDFKRKRGTTDVVLAHIGYDDVNSYPNYTFGGRLDGSSVGAFSFAEGTQVTASGDTAHAEGNETVASGVFSHAEGYRSTASGNYSHAEGSSTTASSWESHAEGIGTTASGEVSHAEGSSTTASGFHSHSEGFATVASGDNSHASGEFTVADQDNQTAIGKYNTKNNTGNLFVVGNGTDVSDSTRSDAFAVYQDGNIKAQGAISDGGGQLGERILTDDAAASRATGRYFNVASVTLPKGMWIVTCACSFADGTNATGIRRSYLTTDAPSGWNNTTTGPASTAIVFYDQVSPLSGNYNSYTRGMGTASITTDTPVTYYLVAYHTAGSAINVTGRINAIRVGTDV